MRENYYLLREFKTAHFRVIADWTEDYDADLSYDESGETLRNVQSGKWVCMLVRVRVLHDTLGDLGVDYLGGCVYEKPEAFMDHKECGAETRRLRASGSNAICGSYFTDMISEAIGNARKEVLRLKTQAYPYIRNQE